MKKIISLFLAVLMVLSGSLALAEAPQPSGQTFSIRFSADRELAGSAMEKLGVDAEARRVADPILAVVAALGMDAMLTENGLRLGLSLNDTPMVTLEGVITDSGVAVTSNLFPNHLITLSAETFAGMMQQFMPAAGGGDGTGAQADELARILAGFTEAYSASMTPGEPETGEYEFDGYTFDTRTPVAVDSKSLGEACVEGLKELLQNGTVQGMLQSAQGFDADALIAKAEEMTGDANRPDVTVDIYTNSDGSEPYYTVSEATYPGAEAPAFRMTTHNKGEGIGTFGFWAFESGMIIGVDYSPSGVRADYTQGELWAAIAVETEEGGAFRSDLYLFETAKPVLSLAGSLTTEAERLQAPDAEGKIELGLETILDGSASKELLGLTMDIALNGWGKISKAAAKAVPEINDLMALIIPAQGGAGAGAPASVPAGPEAAPEEAPAGE